MEEAKSMTQQQEQFLLQKQQQQQQQQLLLLQQLQKQTQHQHQQAIARFPSNIDAHLRTTPGVLSNRHINILQNSNSAPNSNPNPNSAANSQPQRPPQQPQQQQQIRPLNQAELQMAYQDALRVCHPDFKRPFSSLEDACERLLPYHVVADYEAEEDDRILDSDPTGQMPSRSQQWDHNIAAKVVEFTDTFEKLALAFNAISSKQAAGEFQSEERLMVEHALLQEEKRAMFELRAEIESREKAGHEAKIRMAAMVQAKQARAESQTHAEIMARGPIRANALGPQGGNLPMSHAIGEQSQGVNPDEMMNDWGNNAQKDEKEPSEDFLNDEENDNGDTDVQNEWREVEEFDLNSR